MWDFFISIFVNVLIWIYDVVGNNFGLAIILFTILIRIVTWPLNAQQMKGAAAMQALQSDKDCKPSKKSMQKTRKSLPRNKCVFIARKASIHSVPVCPP
jgi:YidC/Oxa1 family membrane protein insertase